MGMHQDFAVVDGMVEAIFVAAAGSRAMQAVDEVQALEGRGLEGDRYCTRRGYWTGVDECQVTLIEGEDLDRITAEYGVAVTEGQHRRNIVTRGLDLSDLYGRRFRVGQALFEFDRPRPPCRYIASITEAGMTRALGGRRGGICARVLQSGIIRPGDRIEVVEAPAVRR
jgi:MOSC domain-containing protein YiiM